MEDLALACLYCAAPVTEDQGDYCSLECADLHRAEQFARLGGKARTARCGHLVPGHPGRQRRACDPCRAVEGEKPQTWPIVCCGCGIEASAGHQRQRYCTITCRSVTLAKERAARIEAKRTRKSCPVCAAPLEGRSLTAIYCSLTCGEVARGMRLPAPLPLRVCALPDCDVEFQPNRKGARCCSEAHGKKLWHVENPGSVWTDARRDAYHRRRALKANTSTGRPVRLAEIRERDGNRCHLCGDRVSAKVWPHPLSASLDHVIPLSRGGIHDPDNVRLAHLRCNVEKGNGGGNEQLLLIG